MQSRASMRGDVKYFAMTVVMALHVEDGPDQVSVLAFALQHLENAVRHESRVRARCRDTDLKAATRQRAW